MTMRNKAKVLEDSDVAKLLADVRATPHGARDVVALLFGFKCGLRACEIARIRWEDVSDARGALLPEGVWIDLPAHITKGKKRDSRIMLHGDVRAALIDLMKQGAESPEIIYSASNPSRGTTVNALTVHLHRLYEEHGFVGCSSHSGRRSYITKLSRICNLHGSSMKDVQLLARHSDIRTTEAYMEPATRLINLAAAA
jgi:integrase